MKQIQLIFILLLITKPLFAQDLKTVNKGVLYVSPNTLMTVLGSFDNKNMAQYENNGEVLFKGNFNNDWITTFNPSLEGYTRFEGSTSQEIKGSKIIDLKKVKFDNSSTQPAFRLHGTAVFNDQVDFSKGILNSDDYGGMVVFTQNAAHINTSNDSHVDGQVYKDGSTAFLFPVGDKNFFRFASMSDSGQTTASYAAKYYFENSDPLFPHSSKASNIDLIDNTEYWTFDKINGTDVLLTLSWDENTTPSLILTQPLELIHIVRWDSTQQQWIDEGGAVDINQKTVTTSVNVSGYGTFTLARIKDNNTGDLIIYNAVSPNGDNYNEYFFIDGITKYPNNKVTIYNRWGIKVFETENYDSKGNIFNGYSQGRATIAKDNSLPDGTYFYTLEYEIPNLSGNSQFIKTAGYLYLTKQ
ncbi:gliding motility-associated C-terminal domain-containing protein [Flavobacterium sp. LHD-80]|uniref:gliding motility-associated C-terminal domain-containing protein n=1 Tax=Flavobacterium sp. LHD-80 TaxID=3071411 RepID=UPI0027E1DB81|nr:gliding motility-associated C-terminal domain-containing protein [Flavobacterium sp. LHD-80]MDQ6470615.1 gliding motility-associated C-terminal domain-containing protein [Flavobacterium sp. LHD-80]